MRFSNIVGFVESKETGPGVWTSEVTERYYRGEVLMNARRFGNGEKVNDDLNVSNRISIICDNYILNNSSYIRYVRWGCQDWKVTNIEINHPRIILTLGGVYNGEPENNASGDTGEFYWHR